MLKIIWSFFLLSAFAGALWQSLDGNWAVWNELTAALFASAKSAFSIALNLTGLLCLWLGLLKIAERSGITEALARLLRPLFARIMPGVPADSPAVGSMVMNIAANVLGLDNAATPAGLKAMEQLQADNPHKDTASDAQIMFMVINSSAVTLIPITILMYRSELGSENPAAVFVPILLSTSASTLVGFLSVAVVQKLNVFNREVLGWLFFAAVAIGAAAWGFLRLPAGERTLVSTAAGNMILFSTAVFFVLWGLWRKKDVYELFVEGAKEGFKIAVTIIPYLVAMLTAIAVFRASGMFDLLLAGMEKILSGLGWDTGFVPALPTALMKPLSGSGARAMMIETMQTYGADSFPGFVASIVQGSTETTFYVLAVYFGAVKITKTRSALPCALLADLAGIVTAIAVGYCFYDG